MRNSDFLSDLSSAAFKKYSQCGEEGILLKIFENIGTTNKYLVDFGAWDGSFLSNTKLLLDEYGWQGLLMDGDNRGNEEVKQEFITAENICDLFHKYKVPVNFDLLSIDVDGNDYYIIESIMEGGYRPRVILTEFNGTIPNGVDKVIKYNPEHVWANNDYYGYSYTAGLRLAEELGYKVVCQHSKLNFFMIDASENLDWSKIKLDEFIHQPYHAHSANREWVIR